MDFLHRLRKKVLGMVPIVLGAGLLTVVLAMLMYAAAPLLPTEYQTVLLHVQRGDWAASRAELSQLFDTLGEAKPYVFLGMQMLQVVFAPIPGQVMGLLGGYLFGF